MHTYKCQWCNAAIQNENFCTSCHRFQQMAVTEQTKPLQRWVGQTIYREQVPTFGPLSKKLLGVTKGTIVSIRENTHDRAMVFSKPVSIWKPTIYNVKWDAQVDWFTGEVKQTPSVVTGGYFDYGILSLYDIKILINGGLLGLDGPVYNEPQSERTKSLIPLYKKIVENPDLPFYLPLKE